MPLQRHNLPLNFDADLLLSSQAQAPEKLFDVLLVTAVKESWIIAIINLHVAIFFGLILLASGYNETASLAYLAIQLSVSVLVGLLMVFLITQNTEALLARRTWSLVGLMSIDALIAAGWGISILIYFLTSSIDQANMLVALLLAAGISTAAMSAKLLRVLVSGRVLVFLPTIVYLLFSQPPNWLLHSTSLMVGFAVCLAVGYAIYVQLLREASLVVELGDTQSKIVREAEFREHFLKAITHDLRQPLSATSLFLRRLKKDYPELRGSELLQSVDQCLQTATNTVDDVAQLSWVDTKLPHITFAAVTVDDVISRVIKINKEIAEQQNVELLADDCNIDCLGDPALIERAVSNLVKNAIEHAKPTQVRISSKLAADAKTVEICVSDNGHGIEQIRQNTIFEAFESNRSDENRCSGHMGIGLSIVQNIVDAHGGQIELKSTLGAGTQITLTLPASGGNEFLSASKLNTDSIESVIILDDDAAFARQLETDLTALGVTASYYSEPDEIKRVIEGKMAYADAYFIDFRISDKLNGEQVLQRLNTPDHPAKNSRKLLISDSNDPQLHVIAAQYEASFYPKANLNERLKTILAR